MITRNGVCYDFTLSKYRHTVNGLTFVFSSLNHLEKFKQKLAENRDIVNYSLSRRFKVQVNANQLADVALYRKIETRGFLIVTNEGMKICSIKEVSYNGGVVTTGR